MSGMENWFIYDTQRERAAGAADRAAHGFNYIIGYRDTRGWGLTVGVADWVSPGRTHVDLNFRCPCVTEGVCRPTDEAIALLTGDNAGL